MANINDKKSKCQILEASELRSLIDDNAELSDIKIISMGNFSLGATDSKKLFHKAQRIQVDGTVYDPQESEKVKIEAILEKFGLKNPLNVYLVATKGRGQINTALQNNSEQFSQAEYSALAWTEDGGKYAVFIDDDARSDLLNFFKAQGEPKPSSYVVAESEDHDLLNATQRLEEEMEVNPAFRFQVLTDSITELSNTCEGLSGSQNRDQLIKLQHLLKVIRMGCIKSKSDFDALKEQSEAHIKSLKGHIETITKNKDEMLAESEEVNSEFQRKITEKEEKIQELTTKLEDTQSAEESNQLNLQLENLEKIKQKLESKVSSQNEKVSKLQTKLQELERDLAKTESVKAKYEAAYNEQKTKFDELSDKLDKHGLNSQAINQTLRKIPEPMVIKCSDEPIEQKPNNTLRAPHFADNIINEKSYFEPSNTFQSSSPQDESSPKKESLPKKESSANEESSQPGDKHKSTKNVICKLSNFGLNTWNPLTTDLQVHLETALKAGQEALHVGAAKTSIRRMILNSLGEKYRYVEGFLKDVSSSENSIEQFTNEIAKVLGKKPSVQMHDFLSAHRKSGEDLLAYFARLCRLYKASANFNNDKWEDDPSHTMSIYSKIYESCYNEQKSEFIRKTEESLGKRTLTLPELRSVLIDVNQVASAKMNAEEPEINNLNHKSAYRYKGENKPKTFEKKPWYENKEKEQSNSAQKKYQKRMDCWHCGKTGHYKNQCYKWIQSKGDKVASPREPQTHGSRE